MSCDVFWLGWGVYTHLIGADNRILFLKKALEQIAIDGKLVISFWYESRPLVQIDKIERISRRLKRRAVERGESFRGVFWGKYYNEEQIRGEAAAAGLKVLYFGHEGYGHAVLTRQ